MFLYDTPQPAPRRRFRLVWVVLAAFLALIASLSLIRWYILPPATFPVPYTLTIEPRQTLFSLSKELQSDGAIRSRRIFEMLMMSFGTDKTVSRGEYYFDHPLSVVELAMRISGREFGVERTKVTIPEGFTTVQIERRLAATFHDFDSAVFETLTRGKEGYLFPDTYIFYPWATTESIVAKMLATYEEKVSPLRKDIVRSGHSERDIIIMASIVEKEANGDEDRAMIAGILWNRIQKGIPLQVDAPFLYILGKESSELTRADLAINSPFNTYKNKGLTPAPIGNPGLDSIEAAINPKDSPYLYYLHDKNGTIYYAKTFAEHQKNIKSHLQ